MQWKHLAREHCSMARTMAVLGDQWTFMILRDCFLGVTRFDDFRKSLGIGRTLLSTRLAKLVEEGVLKKVPYQEQPVRHDYKLTSKGVDLHAVVMHLVAWSDKHAFDGHGPVDHIHTVCGQRFTPQLHCSECGEPVDPRDVKAIEGRAVPRAG